MSNQVKLTLSTTININYLTKPGLGILDTGLGIPELIGRGKALTFNCGLVGAFNLLSNTVSLATTGTYK